MGLSAWNAMRARAKKEAEVLAEAENKVTENPAPNPIVENTMVENTEVKPTKKARKTDAEKLKKKKV